MCRDFATYGADAALIDLHSFESGDRQAAIERTFPSASSFVPIIMISEEHKSTACPNSCAVYEVSERRIEDVEHILISLSCAGFSLSDNRKIVEKEDSCAYRVLLADRRASMTSELANVLRGEYSFDVQVACSGFRCCAMMVEFRPHVIILDHPFDGSAGESLCTYIHACASLRGTKILGITEDVARSHRETAQPQFDDLIERPFAAAELVEKVESLVS